MFDLICVTNRKLCKDDFLTRVDRIAASLGALGQKNSGAIILREKDLTYSEYESLAKEVLALCNRRGATCILHNYADVAIKLNSEGIHLPLAKLLELSEEDKRKFKYIGASCHSAGDVLAAQKAGASYVTLGHIFATDCKKDLPPKGVEFLQKVCESASVPLYAIGGINAGNIQAAIGAKANGVCVMSGLMQCEDVDVFIKSLLKEIAAKRLADI